MKMTMTNRPDPNRGVAAMKATFATVAALVLAVFAQGTLRAAEPRWKQHTINGKSEFEAAGAFDVDNDGKIDIVSGDTWYRAPDWTPHHVRNVTRQGTYYNCFATLPMDVNADGKTDFVTCGYFSRNVGWVENPGATDKDWTYHLIDLPGTSEAAALVDLNGDGMPDVLPNVTTQVVWYQLVKAVPAPEWKKHDLGKPASGHGVGSGDVNGDGRIDLLTLKGWFEAPSNPSSDTWAWHPEWQLGATGIQILARDVNGDGLSDVIWGMGHTYGLFWLEQGKGTGGERTWTRHEIDNSIASVHTLIWADLDGDGKDDLVTGKRVYAHEVEPGATDGSVIAYYQFDRGKGQWQKHVIFQGEAAKNAPAKNVDRLALRDFPPGTAGTGLQMTAIDIDRDGDLDLLCPGKSGLYLFENLGAKP
jgi:hypothetical protein